jgi:hypothetical protein
MIAGSRCEQARSLVNWLGELAWRTGPALAAVRFDNIQSMAEAFRE